LLTTPSRAFALIRLVPMTIVALALRQADHIAGAMQRREI
jgi:hypothetical protein